MSVARQGVTRINVNGLASDVAGEGPTVKVRFTKKQGAPIRFVSGDDPDAAAAIREGDFQKKYYLSHQHVAENLKLAAPKV